MPQQDSKRSAYKNVMLMYLIIGAAGLVFWIGFTLDDLGWLQPAVEFLFGGFADHVLVWLNILSVILIIMIAGVSVVLLIHAIRFWYSWRVVLPVASMLIAIVGFAVTFNEDFEELGIYLVGGGLGTFVISAFLIGLEWARCGIRGFRG